MSTWIHHLPAVQGVVHARIFVHGENMNWEGRGRPEKSYKAMTFGRKLVRIEIAAVSLAHC